MSSQHDWQKHLGLESEAADRRDPADPATSAGEPDQPDEAGAAAEAKQPDGAGQPDAAGQQAGTSAGDHGHSGWSGRAVGPLSRLLPGGAAELRPDEMPVGLPASEVAADEEDPVTPSAGDYESAAGAGDHEPSAALVGEASPGARLDEAAGAAEEPEPSPTSTDDRWHAVLVGFVDDPRGSVEEARALIDEDIAAHVALLARRREAMHAAWQAHEDADTEALRVALVKYRDLRKRLADLVSALTA